MTDKPHIWGATPKAWQSLHHAGLTADLLPVVSNPGAKISPDSKMKALGKTPSVYNRDGYVAGIPKWADNTRASLLSEIRGWARQSDYGICIRTRVLHALDVDIEDPTQAKAIYDAIQKMFEALGQGALVAVRYRENSTKFLIPFFVDSDQTCTKRSFKTEHGAVEFLADGQQFVAIGTHKSGVPYLWRNLDFSGKAVSFPSLPDYAFEALFDNLAEAFAVEAVTLTGSRVVLPGARSGSTTPDPLADYLEENGWILSYANDGARLNIRCPFEAEHTTESAESSTQYFVNGSAGIERGHFKCLHAHCAHRTDGDFEIAIGYIAFEDMTHLVPVPRKPPVEVAPDLKALGITLDRKDKPLQTVENYFKAVGNPTLCGYRIAYDTFKDEIMLAAANTDAWINFEDQHYMFLRIRLERIGLKVSREILRDAVYAVSKKNTIDSAILWLNSLTWDGVPRIHDFWAEYFSVPSTPYSKACSLYFWTALAGRILDPGCQADMALILKGSQGLGKTSGLKALVPARTFYVTLNLSDRDVDVSRAMRGVLIGEIEELRGLDSRESEAIKAFISRTEEKWVPKFKEFTSTFPRRLIFVGTTNKDEVLTDPTGNRRWLPLTVGRPVNVDKIKKDREQLWAEAAVVWKQTGQQFTDAQTLATEVHDDYLIKDLWDNKIWFWLDQPYDIDDPSSLRRGEVPFDTDELIAGALQLDVGRLSRKEAVRIGDILRRSGYEYLQCRVKGSSLRVRKWFLKGLRFKV